MVTSRPKCILFGVLASVLFAADVGPAQEKPRAKRPVLGQLEEWQKKYDRLTPEERVREWFVVYLDENGLPVRGDTDPQVRYRTDALGNKIRYVVPVSPSKNDRRVLITLQDEILQQNRKELRERERVLNERTQEIGKLYYDKKGEAQRAEQRLAEVREERRRLQEKWDVKNYVCSAGANWNDCVKHPEEKRKWLEDAAKELFPFERAVLSAEGRLNTLKTEGKGELSKWNEAKKQLRELEQSVTSYHSTIKQQNSGELWLHPKGKSPLVKPK